MKLFRKTEDGVFDSLLRAYVSRPAGSRKGCPDFDPDLTNAYIERRLVPSSQSRFEEHLSECAACRKSVVTLVRLAQADAPGSAFPARGEARAARLSGVAQVFGALTRPQWAMAAAGVIVLAISLPVLLSRNDDRVNNQVSQTVIAEQESSAEARSATQPAELSRVAGLRQTEADSSTSGVAASKQRQKQETEEHDMKALAAPPKPDAPTGSQVSSEQSDKLQAKSAPESIDQVRTKTENQPASQVPAQAGGQVAGETRLAKEDGERARQQGKDSALTNEAKAPRADEDRTEKEKARRVEEAVAPPPPASGREAAARSNREMRRPGAKLALRDGNAGESVRPAERKISSKKFLFRDDTWIDKDFDPDKVLPVVTIIRDSNVYKEVLGKRAGLKPYLTAFSGTDRAIIVYKGTVYKLIPQETK